MIEISKTAQQGLTKALEQSGEFIGLRLVVHGDAPALYRLEITGVKEEEKDSEDTVLDFDALHIYLDPQSLPKAEGLSIDAAQNPEGPPHLKCSFPPPQWDDPLEQQVQELIDKRVNPSLQSHGGFVGLLRVVDGTAELVMGGGCQGCSYSTQTMHEVVETMIKEEIPDIKAVVDKTNHAMGESPYQQS